MRRVRSISISLDDFGMIVSGLFKTVYFYSVKDVYGKIIYSRFICGLSISCIFEILVFEIFDITDIISFMCGQKHLQNYGVLDLPRQ